MFKKGREGQVLSHNVRVPVTAHGVLWHPWNNELVVHFRLFERTENICFD